MTKEISTPKKWPGRYSMRASFWDTKGRCLDIETDLSKELFEDIIRKITDYIHNTKQLKRKI
jgi:hypothetical protein